MKTSLRDIKNPLSMREFKILFKDNGFVMVQLVPFAAADETILMRFS